MILLLFRPCYRVFIFTLYHIFSRCRVGRRVRSVAKLRVTPRSTHAHNIQMCKATGLGTVRGGGRSRRWVACSMVRTVVAPPSTVVKLGGGVPSCGRLLCCACRVFVCATLPPRDTSPHQDSAGTAPGGTPPSAQPPPPPQTRGTQSQRAPTPLKRPMLTPKGGPGPKCFSLAWSDHLVPSLFLAQR